MSATIFAVATPPGRSAIAVVRVSGHASSRVIEALCGPTPEPRRAVLRKLRDPATGDILDEALVLFFKAPRSETGEDQAELHLHGGRAIVAAVMATLAAMSDCRMAEPGEFAKRAFENGKLDLAQIEGLADLIDAETQAQRQQAVAQAMGVQSARFDGWRSDVLRALGLVEAAIDFSDEEDVSERAVEQAEAVARTLTASLRAQLDDGHRGEILRDGFRVVLAGAPNAGKSSLLNALARRDAAIVSAEAGTTRDVIDVRLDLEGVAVIVSDTAGIRETASSVEQEGIRRTLQAAREADLVVWLQAVDRVEPDLKGAWLQASADMTDESGQRAITVLTKVDLVAAPQMIHVKQSPKHRGGSEKLVPPNSLGGSPVAQRAHNIALSATTGTGVDELIKEIARRAREAVGDARDPAITRVRHRREIEAAIGHLAAFVEHPEREVELRAEDLRLAGVALGRLTGRIDSEEVLGEIFARFCIGK